MDLTPLAAQAAAPINAGSIGASDRRGRCGAALDAETEPIDALGIDCGLCVEAKREAAREALAVIVATCHRQFVNRWRLIAQAANPTRRHRRPVPLPFASEPVEVALEAVRVGRPHRDAEARHVAAVELGRRLRDARVGAVWVAGAVRRGWLPRRG